ncbi:ABC transporter permease [Enterococcus camelliae]|uniref:ABC transporter permease n=1 Tax=Enterococcus camelliae TaxID=453959 RepID=A0ABW5THT8_9ENTE
MRQLLVFTRKEWVESWRTTKGLILVSLFFFFGVLSPLTAKFTPELLQLVTDSKMTISVPKPTSVDSWVQFYKNVNQLGLLVFCLLYHQCVSGELMKGTLIPFVTKGLQREVIVLAKWLNMFIQWTLSLVCCFAVTYGYTRFYFPDNASPHVLKGVLALWLFGIFLLTLLLFSSILIRSSYGGLLVVMGVVGLLFFLAFFDQLTRYNPISLVSKNMAFVQGKMSFRSFGWSIGFTVLAIFGGLFASIGLMNRKKI